MYAKLAIAPDSNFASVVFMYKSAEDFAYGKNAVITPEFKTRSQVVAEAIRQQILSGKIPSGAPLRQALIAQQLNVSRIPVREALLQLEAEGLVKFEPHKGATATKLGAEHISELFDLRIMLECDMLQRSIPLLTPADIEHSKQLLKQLDNALQQLNVADRWAELNSQFHLSLYKAARPQTFEMIQRLNNSADRYVRMHLQTPGVIHTASTEHQQLLALCAAKDIAGATTLLRHHLQHAADEIIALYK